MGSSPFNMLRTDSNPSQQVPEPYNNALKLPSLGYDRFSDQCKELFMRRDLSLAGFSKITEEIWKAMSPEDRSDYERNAMRAKHIAEKTFEETHGETSHGGSYFGETAVCKNAVIAETEECETKATIARVEYDAKLAESKDTPESLTYHERQAGLDARHVGDGTHQPEKATAIDKFTRVPNDSLHHIEALLAKHPPRLIQHMFAETIEPSTPRLLTPTPPQLTSPRPRLNSAFLCLDKHYRQHLNLFIFTKRISRYHRLHLLPFGFVPFIFSRLERGYMRRRSLYASSKFCSICLCTAPNGSG
jgi:hypothetical protein